MVEQDAACAPVRFKKLQAELLARHVVPYAHSEGDVLLLSLRHERQLRYHLPG